MPKSDHPNPQLERLTWRDLNGTWRFAYDDGRRWERPEEVIFERSIIVPFPPESSASGIGDTGFHPVVWYALTVQLEETERPQRGQSRLLLHFEAVDYRASVWVNGRFCTEHEGGHTPFTVDLTQAALHSTSQDSPTLEIVVRAEDDPLDMHQPRGKQDWQIEPHVIWYPRTTGIWQTVWLERVPETRLGRITWTADVTRWAVGVELALEGARLEGASVRVRLSVRGESLCDDRIKLNERHVSRLIALPDPGIDDERCALLWSPEHPNLIDAQLELLDAEGCVIDEVLSYTALRTVGHDGQRFTLNDAPYYLKMVLDQGYWPDTLMAATDAQLRSDVEMTKRLGFNGVRKHQKIESSRWLYHCDVLGLLVWEEMPSHYAFSARATERLTKEWLEVIARDRSHPCIVAWVVFNESWGVPSLLKDPAQRHYVQALYALTKTLDPTRLAISNDGWEFAGGDWLGIHDYSHKPQKLLERYGHAEAISQTVTRPWGRVLCVPDQSALEIPVFLSEFGGIAFDSSEEQNWGYSRARDVDEFLQSYESLLTAVHSLRGIAGFCYTQLTDTFKEKNGLLTEDRQPKADLFQLAAATRGERDAHEVEMEGEANPLGYSRRWFTAPLPEIPTDDSIDLEATQAALKEPA